MAHVVWGAEVGTVGEVVEDLPPRRDGASRFVIHLAREHASQIVSATARAIMQRLRERVPGCRIEIIDPSAARGESPADVLIETSGWTRHRVSAPCLRNGAAVPALWLEPFSLITIAGAGPDPRLALFGVLAAQGRLLDVGEGRDIDVIYEAHRLMPSDLAVACGSLVFDEPKSGGWWATSSSDVALEAALARAMGIDPGRLPHLRHIARHEIIDLSPAAGVGATPAMHGYQIPALRMRASRGILATRHIARTLREDFARGAENVHRIPQFIARRYFGAAS